MIVVVPGNALVTNPVVGLDVITFATVVVELDQVPPEVASFKVMVAPSGQTLPGPVIFAGSG